MSIRSLMIALLTFGLAMTVLAELGQAQPVRPVYTTTSKDGRLVGFDTNLPAIGELWKPRAAAAYGFDSGRVRYQAGLEVTTGISIPVIDQRVGNPSLAVVDWPSSPILGREGQSGVELGISVGETHAIGFFGSLWGRDDQPDRNVGYVQLDSGTSFDLAYGVRARTNSVMTVGALMDGSTPGQMFQSNRGSVGLSLDGFSANVRYGSLTNAADLAGFEFTTGVPGLGGPLTGERYWQLTLSRSFPMYETGIPLPVPPEWPNTIPTEIPLTLRGDIGVHVANADRRSEAEGESPNGSSATTGSQQADSPDAVDMEWTSEMGFSWTASLTLSVQNVSVKARLAVPQDGSPRFTVNF